jgi:hypothetical protein
MLAFAVICRERYGRVGWVSFRVAPGSAMMGAKRAGSLVTKRSRFEEMTCTDSCQTF